MRATQQQELEPDLIAQFWALYEIAFQPLQAASPCRQYLHKDEFYEEMTDPRIVKFVLWDDDEPVAMAFVANDLDAIPWISPPYFAARFPEEYAAKTIYYFGALLTVEDRRRAGYGEHILAELINFVVANDGIAAFDTYSVNDMFLPLLIRTKTEEQASLDVHRLDTQTYYAYKARGFNEGYGRGNPFGQETRPLLRSGEAA